MKFWLLTPNNWSWNFGVNPLISSLEKDILFWWEREGCHVRTKEEERKKSKERGIEKEVKELDFLSGAAKKVRQINFWGGVRVMLRKKSHHPLFQLMAITFFTPYKLIFLKRPKKKYNLTYIYILNLIKLYP